MLGKHCWLLFVMIIIREFEKVFYYTTTVILVVQIYKCVYKFESSKKINL